MVLAVAAAVVCAGLLLAGPERRSARAWSALVVMILAMLLALAGMTLIGGVVALLAAPAVVAGVPRAVAMPALHRAAALLATAGCLLGAGSGIPSSHHAAVGLGVPLVVAYLLTAVLAVAHTRRPVVAGEVGVMAAGMLAMTLLG